MLKTLNIAIFFNNYRGLETLNYLKKKRELNIKFVFLAKKYLNNKVLKILRKKKINFKKISNVNSLKISNILKKNKIDINLLCGFPYILKRFVIESAKFGTLNLHAGKLPKYRGGSPLNWQIINDEKNIGISVIKVDTGIDTGQVIAKKKFKLKDTYDIKKVHEISNSLFPILTYLSIKKIIKKKFNKKSNFTTSNYNYYPQRNEKDGKINWKKMRSREVFNFVRALSKPYPGAFTFNKNKKKIFIHDCKVLNNKFKDMQIGEIKKQKNDYYVKTIDKVIKIKSFKGKLVHKDVLI